MRKITTLICYLLLSLSSFAQSISPRELIFTGSHFSVSVIPIVTQKATTTWLSGPYSMGSTAVRGIGAGGNWHFNFNEHLGYTVGLHGYASVRNFTFSIPKEDFTPPGEFIMEENGKGSRIVDMYLSFPILFETRWLLKQNHFLNVSAGINIGFYPDQFSEIFTYSNRDAGGQYYNVVMVDLEVGNNYKPWADYHAAAGYNWILKNNNMLQVNLIYTYSNMELAKGTYTINVPGKPVSTGTYHSNLTHAGLAFSYFFTRTGKRLLNYQKTNGARS
jgi:hypothetical protein